MRSRYEIPVWVWFALGLGLFGAWQHEWAPTPLQVPPGLLLAPNPPVQSPPAKPAEWRVGELQLTALADFEFEARLLSVHWYGFGPEAEISPVDLALGWGQMSDSAIIERMQYQHGGRYFSYRWSKEPPIPRAEITRSVANVHVIPGYPELVAKLRALVPGSKLQGRGQLVRVRGADGWLWQSSLSREDDGRGACELLWLTELRVLSPP